MLQWEHCSHQPQLVHPCNPLGLKRFRRTHNAYFPSQNAIWAHLDEVELLTFRPNLTLF